MKIRDTLETVTGYPELETWICPDENSFYVYENEVVRAKYEEYLDLTPGTILSTFYIKKNHYKKKMPDIVKHINYFLTYYDEEKELFLSTLSVKYIIDQRPQLSQDAFRNMILDRVVTDTLISKIKLMAHNLYKININTDKEGKFKSTPKITNIQAKQLVAISFCLKLIIPLCLHFSNINDSFVEKKDYIPCFDKIYMKIVEKFEKDDIPVFNALCKFVKYRVDRSYSADKGIWNQKKQLYGIVKELYLEELIHDVIFVKSLHKLEYNRSCVSFIDGIIFNYNINFKQENYKSKPFEISSDDNMSDNDDYLSHTEALEMSVYRIDESNAMINNVNSKKVMQSIQERFNIKISKEEFQFYYDNCVINSITQFLLHSFYAPKFKNTYAIYAINRADTIKLIIYMKKFLQLKGMTILPQIVTARVKGKFKENAIKNSKFVEKFKTSSVVQNIINTKFRYIKELNSKDDPIDKKLSTIINSTFELVDYNQDINGLVYSDINIDVIIDEFSLFLSII